MAVQTFNLILFPDFETLDTCGPAEILGQLADAYRLVCTSYQGGIIKSKQQIPFETIPFSALDLSSPLLLPGGLGTRPLVENNTFLDALHNLAVEAPYVLTVCTGSALLARTGLLDDRQATSNKMAFAWAESQGPKVKWQRSARWVKDGKFYTSSGVSAGIDMALAFVAEHFGLSQAEDIARYAEYVWNRDPDNDPFAI